MKETVLFVKQTCAKCGKTGQVVNVDYQEPRTSRFYGRGEASEELYKACGHRRGKWSRNWLRDDEREYFGGYPSLPGELLEPRMVGYKKTAV